MTTEHDEFWGDEAGWSASPTRDHTTEHPLVSETTPARGVGRRASRLWSSVLTSGSTAGRAHGSNSSGATDDRVETKTALNPDNEINDVSEQWDAGWDVSPAPVSSGGVDPLLAKFGGVAVVLTLLIPLAIGLRSGGDEQLIEAAAEVSAETGVEESAPADPAVPTSVAVATTVDSQASTNSATAPDAATPSSEAEVVATTVPPTVTRSVSGLDGDSESSGSSTENIAAPAEAEAPAVRAESVCPIKYEVVVGDFWIRIADGAGVSTNNLLALNGANSGTALYPGSSICLPAGSKIPSPPPAPSPATTSPATTAAPTTAAPTTSPPTTAAPAPPPPPTAPDDIEAIIRYVWPDELEEKALQVAWRESRYVPTAKNFCCYGLFQMYWEVHSDWLGDMGITSANQLFDPATNARAAYALYQRAGGWGPWAV